MVSLYKRSSDPTVLQFLPPMDMSTRLRRGLKRRLMEREWRKLPGFSGGATLFSEDRAQHGADVLRQLPPTDILNLHWVAGYIDYEAFFRKLPRGIPVVWTLHDMNSFTGGCHYDETCGRFAQRCGACPQIGSADAGDVSSIIWRRKQEAFSSRGARGLRIVAPSRWLAKEVRRSSLLSGHSTTVIPYGVDVESFQPRDRKIAREKYGIPADAKTVLFVADSGGEKRKGLSVLLEALNGLGTPEEFIFLAIGHGLEGQELQGRLRTIGFLDEETALSFAYAAADVFVVPSLQDNLPNTAIEALACGIPTIGSRVGGVTEVIREGQTGLLVPPGNSGALRQAIAGLLNSRERLASMARESRRVAVEEYSLEIQAAQYVDLYEQMIPKK